MEDNNLILSWDDFEFSTLNSFKDQLHNSNFTDVTLVTNDKQQIKANMVVLSSASEVFRNCLPNKCCLNSSIVLIDLPYKYLELVIQFIYTGRCDVKEKDLLELLDTGKALGVNGLTTNLSIESCEVSTNKEDSKQTEIK